MSGRSCLILLSLLLLCSCSTTRVLEKDEYRLARNSVTIEGAHEGLTPGKVSPYIRQKSNGSGLFGWNPFLYMYNWSRKDGFWHKIGTAPVVYDKSAVGLSISNIATRLDYLGYYDSKVDTVIVFKGRNVHVDYRIKPGRQYPVRALEYSVPEDGSFREEFLLDTANIAKRLMGAPLSEQMLEEESAKGAAYFRDLGYFTFNRNHYSFEADTIGGKALLKYNIHNYTRSESPENAAPLEKYRIGKVNISYPSSVHFRPGVLKGLTTIRPGDLYSSSDVNNSYSRLSALRVFSSVSIEMTPRDNAQVDAAINLTPAQLQGIKLNMEASSNSSGLIGISPKFNYFHRNLFHGGEWFNLGFTGAFQFKINDDTRATEYGVTAGLSLPRFLGLPYSAFKRASVPRTEFNGAFNYQNRPEYTRTVISTAFGYSGMIQKLRLSYQLYPLQLNFVRLFDLQSSFSATLDHNPYMRYAFQDHLDAGVGGVLYYNSSTDIVPQSSYRFQRLAVDVSGNVLAAFKSAMPRNKDGAAMIGGSPFAQYVRAEYSFGKTWRYGFNDEKAIATRLLIGGGYAYGNSSALPYEKQFYAGGASSMRGWQARALGPGAEAADKSFIIPSQTGGLKLEANIEYRFDIIWKLDGALFADIGNVWNIQGGDKNAPGRFRFNDFYKSLAADWGLGLRVNLEFILLRLDWGIKLYDPSKNEDSRLIDPHKWLGRSGSALHFGIGYPF